MLLQKDMQKKETTQATTDAEGIVKFELQMDTEKYVYSGGMIECDLEGYDLACVRANMREEMDLVMTIHKSDKHWEAEVLDAETGKPIAEATARVRGMQIGDSGNYASFDEESEMEFQSDSRGHVEFARFSIKDQISVDVTAPGYSKEQKWLSARSPEDSVFRLSLAGTITGKVRLTDSGEPPDGLRVLLEMPSESRVREYVTAEKDGSFSCDHCKPGSYKLTANSFSEQGRKYICCSDSQVEVKAGQTVEVVIEMEKGTSVSGTMIDAATGKPPEDRDYAYVRTADGRTQSEYSRINEDGGWELFLPEGDHSIIYRCGNMSRQQEFKRISVEKGKPIKDLVIKVGAEGG